MPRLTDRFDFAGKKMVMPASSKPSQYVEAGAGRRPFYFVDMDNRHALQQLSQHLGGANFQLVHILRHLQHLLKMPSSVKYVKVNFIK